MQLSWIAMLLAYFGIIVLALSSIEGAQVSKKYTRSPTGCVCWFDLEGKLLAPNSCACCRPGGRQCGYPRQNICTKITKDDDRTGCSGKPYSYLNEYQTD